MTDLRAAAEAALDQIVSVPKGLVYAARKGICAGVDPDGNRPIMFRRKDGVVRMEVWRMAQDFGGEFDVYPLPSDLESRAAQMLDQL